MFQLQDWVALTTTFGELVFEGWDGFSKSWLTTVFGLFALEVCRTWYVGMCFNNGYSLALIISGLSYFVAVFWWEFYQLPFWAWSANLRINFGRNYLSHGPQILHHCQYVVYLFSFRSNQFIYLKKCVGFVSSV